MSGDRLWLREPLVPVKRIVKFPGDALELEVRINDEVAFPPEGGVTGDAIDTEIPAGAFPNHEGVKVTGELNPFSECTVIVTDPVNPCINAIVVTDEDIEKSPIVVTLLLVED